MPDAESHVTGLREARAKGVFDALEQMDAVAFLHRRDANSADLIVAPDVLVYMRGLEDLMREAARARRTRERW